MISDENKKYRILAVFLMTTRYDFFFLFFSPLHYFVSRATSQKRTL